MTILILFVSSFAIVFLLGLQSLSVNGGHERAAFFNSALIGIANIVLLKNAPTATGWEIAAYICGGPIGIVCSMRFFRWYRQEKGRASLFEAAKEVSRVWDEKKALDDHRTNGRTSLRQDNTG